MEMRALDDHTESPWERIAPYLDQGLNELNSSDRHALVLRFLKRQDFRAVGAALGISEDSAQKRVSRALEKRSEEHTSELQSQSNFVSRLLLEKKKNNYVAQYR